MRNLKNPIVLQEISYTISESDLHLASRLGIFGNITCFWLYKALMTSFVSFKQFLLFVFLFITLVQHFRKWFAPLLEIRYISTVIFLAFDCIKLWWHLLQFLLFVFLFVNNFKFKIAGAYPLIIFTHQKGNNKEISYGYVYLLSTMIRRFTTWISRYRSIV